MTASSLRIHIAAIALWLICSGFTTTLLQPGIRHEAPGYPGSAHTESSDSSVVTEHFRILSDRRVYITGETVSVRVFPQGSPVLHTLNWSRVYYLEIVDPSGTDIARSKLRLDRNGGAGVINIPGDVTSGTYFLRGYTRWMRNCDPATFNYLSIEILNPHRDALLPVDTAGHTLETRSGLTGTNTGELTLHTPPAPRAPRTKSTFTLKNTGVHEVSLCVTIGKRGALHHQHYSTRTCIRSAGTHTEYIPETRGVTLTGRVTDESTGEPVPFAVVNISVLDRERDFFCNYTDSTGRFYFSFPGYTGEKELFVSAIHPDRRSLAVQINRDFSQSTHSMPSLPLLLGDSLEPLYTELSVNAQVYHQYQSQAGVPGTESEESTDRRFFYGEPLSVLHFEDFIKLPTLEEYFTELIPQVYVRKREGEKTLVLPGNQHGMQFYRPLVMIDGIAIFDTEAVLAVSPRTIERIEIIDRPYVRGNVTYGGIINIISRNDDLGYVDLPSSGLLLDYRMVRPPLSPQQFVPEEDPNIPDVRNTLYWNPDISLAPGEECALPFYTNDLPGSYEILVRGFDTRDRYVESSAFFEVEESGSGDSDEQ